MVRGVVQGVGFRPFVARLAAELGVVGFCGNDVTSVFVEAEGPESVLDRFVERLHRDAPPAAVVVAVETWTVPTRGEAAFTIVPSRHSEGRRTLVPPDTAVCADCLRELFDPADRRYRHPFISCTNCGPRFTIITDLPYDRPVTTMTGFPLCPRCRAEYDDPADRRFHAQPVACHDCGPRIRLEFDQTAVTGDDRVLGAAHARLAAGEVLAVKGIGGYHLACRADVEDVVQRLRDRKHRPDKPFALMVRDLEVARRLVEVGSAAERALTSTAAPIVLLRRRPGSGIVDAVAPRLDELGLMLPYTPLHHLLFASVPGSDVPPPDVLVMTSANLSGEPLCWQDDDARTRMAGIADAFLINDRPIAVPCEDSIVRIEDGVRPDVEVVLRRSRGMAPLPTEIPATDTVVLAVGAELKNTITIAAGPNAYTSAHLGDMSTLEAREAFLRSVDHLIALHGVPPQAVAADLHPGFLTSRWAAERAEAENLPLLPVQHHHAHLASLLAEHGRVGRPVIGAVFDGTGLGCDRHVWGGEILAIGEDVTTAERVGHLEEFPLPGGDVAVRQPFRVALALLHHAGLAGRDWTPAGVPEAAVAAVRSQLRSGIACVPTSSVGRLFDGVASLLGVRHAITYEAQAAIELEAAAATASAAHPLSAPVVDGRILVGPLVAAVVAARDAGVPVPNIALGFHEALTAATVELLTATADRTGVRTVGISGGVFANRILARDLARALARRDLDVLTHSRIPGNDGGLALGQAVVARAMLRKGRRD
ncbi:carbamoyltransferase HypF [Sporichthya brevicatena]|uniref:Carbamoyltransferase n=1 Tax=Sporichthya brevicatena TaxID=171442 RepID=A0ABP3RW75_9ACTN